METTLLIFKPDALKRRLVGRILSRFEEKGLRIAGLKMTRISTDLAERHYGVHKDKPFYPGLIRYITSSPVVLAAISGPRAVEVCRKMMGATFGWKADPGTIRGDFGVSNSFNLIHGSDSPESAAQEVSLFFDEGDLHDYDLPDDAWVFDAGEDA
jgi:nucleoside-diphosphate kinase